MSQTDFPFNSSIGGETFPIVNDWGTQCLIGIVNQLTFQILALFYILSPEKTTFDNPYDVPNYEVTIIPAIGLLIILEQIIRFYQRKEQSRIQDIVLNTGSSLIFTLTRVFLLSVVIIIFSWLYENYRIIDLPLHSVTTWLLSLLLVEFVYYWTHRALHEFNILWAAHQFHHMAEDVNITTTVRDSIVDLIIYDIFPLPLAIIIPPSILVVHIQFSLIYQIWLHNDVVGNLGFIEYIINTPRQHRVHHGRNPYCIDKNYGALIMIWDRIFGTHQTENEKIVYGVVSPMPKTFDPMTLQFGYYRDVWKKFREMKGINNKLSALFKGPGWAPGKPRLGLISDVPEPDLSMPKYNYDPYVSMWKKYYVTAHGAIVMLGFYLIADHPLIRYSPMKGLIGIFYIIYLLTSFGAIFDGRSWAGQMEVTRCLLYYVFDYYIIETTSWPIQHNVVLLFKIFIWSIRVFHLISIVLWILLTFIIRNNGYQEAATMEKDVESSSSSMVSRARFCTFFILFSILAMMVAFWIAWALQVKECSTLFNQW